MERVGQSKRDDSQRTGADAAANSLFMASHTRCCSLCLPQWFCHVSIVALLYFVTGFEGATIVTRNWMSLFWIANFAGFTLSVLVYIKAHLAPTHVNDLKWSGSIFYDLFMVRHADERDAEALGTLHARARGAVSSSFGVDSLRLCVLRVWSTTRA